MKETNAVRTEFLWETSALPMRVQYKMNLENKVSKIWIVWNSLDAVCPISSFCVNDFITRDVDWVCLRSRLNTTKDVYQMSIN
jgi:hypothetical protein